MPLDGLTYGFIARELEAALLGGRVDKVQQPEKDMVLLHIRAAGQSHRLLINANPTGTRLHLTQNSYESPLEAPVFCMLMRKHLVAGRVQAIRQVEGDRLLCMEIAAQDELGEKRNKQLWFEAMGRHTNLSLVQEGRIIDSIRHVTDEMSRVRRMLPGASYEMPPAQNKLSPEALDGDLLAMRLNQEGGRADRAVAAVLSGIGVGTAREICLRLTGEEQPQLSALKVSAFAHSLVRFVQALPAMAQPMLYLDEQGLPKEALPFPFLTLPHERQQAMDSLSQALDTLHYEKDRHNRLMQRSSAFRRTLKAAEERAIRKLALQEEELGAASRMEEYRVAGELLTAYGHMVQKGAESVTLPNYYDGGEMEVLLEVALSPAQNAQRYFKKYRKAHTGRRLAAQQKEKTLEELRLIEDATFALQHARSQQDLSEIKEPMRQAGIIRREAVPRGKARPRKESQPLRYRSEEGFSILVGRNSLQNERLLKLAQGTDLWLHAKDMPGSHVIVQLEGREAPEATLLLAARLAAFYSKGEGVSVPVNYTLRRYVKKPGSAPAGFVTFTNEKLLIASAAEAELKPFEITS
ncbi:MAG: fibronectin/fibrinogen-binding protein [Clostridiales bacterium]|nr:fibronectin/fibrinogen-binding protein [Clostridiales bacterium]